MSPKVRAAGAVVLRNRGDRREVLTIHRQRYDDWSLPKGKAYPDEARPVTAVREVREETGVLARLDVRLSSLSYGVGRRTKQVDYWRASVVASHYREPDREVDEVRWLSIDEANRLLTYPSEVRILDEALALPDTVAVLLVRHAKAMLRKDWTGRDQRRRLTGRGRRQAGQLVPLLEAYRAARLASSPAVRCMETLAPYAAHAMIDIDTFDLFTEEEGTTRQAEVEERVRRLAAGLKKPTVLCGHRPVLPAMRAGLSLPPAPMVVGEVTVVHRDKSGRNVSVETHKPTV